MFDSVFDIDNTLRTILFNEITNHVANDKSTWPTNSSRTMDNHWSRLKIFIRVKTAEEITWNSPNVQKILHTDSILLVKTWERHLGFRVRRNPAILEIDTFIWVIVGVTLHTNQGMSHIFLLINNESQNSDNRTWSISRVSFSVRNSIFRTL